MIVSKIPGWGYKTILKTKNVSELWRGLEECAYDYLSRLQVQDEQYHPKSLSGKWGKHPFGYFMVYNPGKITIYHKRLAPGYLYNSVKVDKVVSFFAIEPTKKEYQFLPRDEVAIQDFIMEKQNEWRVIHDDIEKRKVDVQ